MLPALADVAICLRFFSRLPVPQTRRETALGAGAFPAAAAMVPVAGAAVGCCPALVLLAAAMFGLPPLVAALLALTTSVLVTGALHEDGLADCADGLGGGTPERKLAIMRDSRLGTFGACALGLSLALRGACLAILAARDVIAAAAVIILVASISRTLCLLPLVALPPARSEGLGSGAAGLEGRRFATAALLSAAITGIFAALSDTAPLQVAMAYGAAWIAAFGIVRIARRQIGGQTGDVAGATQQVGEAVMLVVFAAGL